MSRQGVTAGPTNATVAASTSSIRSVTGWVIGFCSSVLADQVFFLSLTWAALQVGPANQVGLVLAAGSIPRLLILLVGGAVADRASPKRIIVATDGGRALVMAVAAALLMLGDLNSWQLITVALAIGALDGLFLPAMGSLPARIAPAYMMGRLAALRTVTQRAAMLVGGPLAGWVIYLYGASAAFWVSAGLFAISVASLSLVTVLNPTASSGARTREADPNADQTGKLQPTGRPAPTRALPRPDVWTGLRMTSRSFLNDVTSGLQEVRRHPVLPWLLLLIAGMNVGFAGPVTAGLPLLASVEQWGARGAGLLLGGFGLGATATGLGLVFVRWLPKAGVVALCSVFVMGVALTSVTVVPTFAAAMLSTIVLGLASGVFGTVVHAMILTSTPEAELGRVMALLSLSIEGVVPISFAGTGVLATLLDARATFAIGGSIIMVTTLVACTRRPLRAFQLTRTIRGAAPASPPG